MKGPTLRAVIHKVILIILLVIVIFPFFWLLVSSFKHEKDIITYPPGIFAPEATIENYLKVWTSIPLLDNLINTVIFAGGVMILSTFINSLAAYAFARMRFKGRKILFYFVLLTMMMPFQIFMIPLFMEVNALGLLDSYAGLIIPRMASATGIFLMRSFFVSLPKELEESARIDGLSEFKIFFKIMLPLCKPAMLTSALLTLMTNWKDLLYPLLLTRSTDMRTLPAGLALLAGENIFSYGPVMAGAVISILPLLIVYIFLQKYFVQGTVTTGMKE